MVADETMLTWIIIPLSLNSGISSEECGQRVLSMASPTRFPALGVDRETRDSTTTTVEGMNALKAAKGTDGVVGSGAYRVTSESDAYSREKRYGELREKRKIYQHTMTVTSEIEAGRPFKG
ncbi:hypothetical protein GGR53DRAFT_249593 [Hypoxylon sp. FL1150]|nr:hypothetical protein GGR53DRAFT_249593 [Hypoxylon sp. FL1150]